jgi:hypothetical protein
VIFVSALYNDFSFEILKGGHFFGKSGNQANDGKSSRKASHRERRIFKGSFRIGNAARRFLGRDVAVRVYSFSS